MRDLQKLAKYAARRKRSRLFRGILTGIAAVVVFCTTYALILPAITLEGQTAYCGFEGHEHSDECYQLVCGREEFVPHYHSQECRNENGELVCHQEETTIHVHSDDCKVALTCALQEQEAHAHSEGCFETRSVLVCTQEEAPGHTHDDGCYQTEKVCGMEETPGHSHDDSCYQTEKVCDREERPAHAHTEGCYAEDGTLVCTQEETEGHSHTDQCFTRTLVCTQEEAPGHSHTDPCFTRTFICTQEETQGHTHTEDCYQEQPVLICEKEEGEGHTHGEGCYSVCEDYQCGHPEGKVVHQHTASCYQLTCDAHVHTEECYVKPQEEPTQVTEEEEILEEDEEEIIQEDEEEIAEEDEEEIIQEDEEEIVEEDEEEIVEEDEEEIVQEDEEEIIQEDEEEIIQEDEEEIVEEDEEEPAVDEEGSQPTVRDLLLEIYTEEELQELLDAYPEYTLEDIWTMLNSPASPDNPSGAWLTTPRSGESAKDFISYLTNDLSAVVVYQPGDGTNKPYYRTSVIMNYKSNIQQIKDDGQEYYLDLNEDILVLDSDQEYPIIDPVHGTAGSFTFTKIDNHYRMLIHFSDEYVSSLSGDITGEMYFTGNVSADHGEDNGDFRVDVVGDKEIYVESKDVIFNNTTDDYYDIEVTKTHSTVVTEGTLGQSGTDGHVKLNYTVEVSSEKGTPDEITLTDLLTWTQSGTTPKNCELYNSAVIVDGQEVELEQAKEGQSRDFTLTLGQLKENEKHIIQYTYDFVFKSGDPDSVSEVENTVKVESKVPEGRPEEKVTDRADDSDEGFSPPFPIPDINKSGTQLEDGNIQWTILFNKNNKEIGENGFVINDVKLQNADDITFYVSDGQSDFAQLDAGISYSKEQGTITIGSDLSQKTVKIIYTTGPGTLGNFGENIESNTASFDPFGDPTKPVQFTAKVKKTGGALQKKAGTISKSENAVTIPWTITITPGKDGIPTDKALTDNLSYNHSFDQNSLQVVYVDENGAELEGTINCSTSFDWNGSNMTLQFTSNPFGVVDGQPVAPAGAVAVQVRYNTTLKDDCTGIQDLSNKANLDPFTDTDTIRYDPYDAVVTKKVTAGVDEQGNDILNWEIWVAKSQGAQITTGIADSLGEGTGTHYFIKDSLQLFYQGWGNRGTPLTEEKYSVTFYADGTLPNMSGNDEGAEKSAYMVINFNEQPLQLPNDATGILICYQTAFEGTPDQAAQYKNNAWIMNQTAEAVYSPPKTEVTKNHGDFTASGTSLTIPWTVTINAVGGSLPDVIRDSLLPDTGTANHYFVEAANNKINIGWYDPDTNQSGEFRELNVSYYAGYDEESLSGTAYEVGKNTYMEISLPAKGEGGYNAPDSWKRLVLTLRYTTVSDGLPTQATVYQNTAWADDSRAVDQYPIDPKPPKVESKYAVENDRTMDAQGITVPWTVKIKRGTLPPTVLYDGLYGTENSSLIHYFIQDPDTISIEYADASGNGLGKFVPKDRYTPTFYSGFTTVYNQDGSISLTPIGDPTDQKSTFMVINFSSETDAFDGSPDDTAYLLLRYRSKTDGPPVGGAEYPGIRNVATISGEKVEGGTSVRSSRLTKKAQSSENGAFVETEVDVGKNDTGALAQWEISALTGAPYTSSKLVLTDELPEYVLLKGITGQWKQWGGYSDLNLVLDAASGEITGGDNTYVVSGSCRLNENNRYFLSIEVTGKNGAAISDNTNFCFYLQPQVDVKNLPVPLRGKDFLFSNTAEVNSDGFVMTSNPSVQKWEHDYPDVAQQSLEKTQMFASGKKSLVYTVDINPKGKDLEYASNSVVLIDTLTYTDNVFKNVNGISDSVTLERLNITLNTGVEDPNGLTDEDKLVKKPTLYYAAKDSSGTPILKDGRLVKGSAVNTALWSMTTDRLDLGNHQIQNVIRLSVPDETALILEYAYDVEVECNPKDAKTQQLTFEFEAENTVDVYGHKNSFSTTGGKAVEFLAAKGGGTASTASKTLTIKKVDAVNESILLGNAMFDLQKFENGTWNSILGVDEEGEPKYLPTSNEEQNKGTIVIYSDNANNGGKFELDTNTLYRVVEVKAPNGYQLPEEPEEIRFYISGTGGSLPDNLKNDAVDLSVNSKTVIVTNTSNKANFSVQKSWADNKGNPVKGDVLVNFKLCQLKSTQKPEEIFSPLASTRTVRVTVKTEDYNVTPASDGPITVPKGTKVQAVFRFESGDKFDDSSKYPAIPSGLTVLEQGCLDETEYRVVFAAQENLDLTFTVKTYGAMSVSLTPLSNGGGISGGGSAVSNKEWDITLGGGGDYTWYSFAFDSDDQAEGFQPLLYTEIIDDQQYWYSYYVVEENPGGYIVTYDNVDENNNFVGVSFTDIHVLNTDTNAPTYRLPNTGGSGRVGYTFAGLTFTAGAVLGLMKKRRKWERD